MLFTIEKNDVYALIDSYPLFVVFIFMFDHGKVSRTPCADTWCVGCQCLVHRVVDYYLEIIDKLLMLIF